jgi:hypothetical protein
MRLLLPASAKFVAGCVKNFYLTVPTLQEYLYVLVLRTSILPTFIWHSQMCQWVRHQYLCDSICMWWGCYGLLRATFSCSVRCYRDGRSYIHLSICNQADPSACKRSCWGLPVSPCDGECIFYRCPSALVFGLGHCYQSGVFQ